MASGLIVWVGFCVFFCKDIDFVRCAECKTHAECTDLFAKYCCGGGLLTKPENRPKRAYRIDTCLHNYCETDSDCGDSSMCCRSNKCVNKGCLGCTKNSDCYSTLLDKHVCCKKTFPFNETLCGDDCIGQSCKSNDDCAGRGECCRLNKCVDVCGKCTMNSECDSDEYCCRKKKPTLLNLGDNCAESCIGKNCDTDDDCGEPNVCCISNKCVDRGCPGCTKNSDCYSTALDKHVCCKKTFSFNETLCGDDCIGQTCNSNDDCAAGRGECCRLNKCVDVCSKCTMNSECASDEYCCRKKETIGNLGDNCAKSCIWKNCATEDDCGEPDLCCISNKCVDRGCSGCTKNSDCYVSLLDKHVCCKKTFPFNETLCGDDCIGQTCKSNDDCAGRGECCRSNKCVNTCDERSTWATQNPTPTPQNQSPIHQPQQSGSSPGRTAGIAIAVLLVFGGVSIALIWYYKRKRPGNTTQVHRGTVALQNTQSQGTVTKNLQQNQQFSGFNNPMQQQQWTGFSIEQSPSPNNPQNNQAAMYASSDRLDDEGYVVSKDSCIDHTYENPDQVKDTIQQQSCPQLYPQSASNPHPYNPHYPGNYP